MKKFDNTLCDFLLASRPGDVWDIEVVADQSNLAQPADDTPAERWRCHIVNLAEMQNRLAGLAKAVWAKHRLVAEFDAVMVVAPGNDTLVDYTLENSVAISGVSRDAVLALVEDRSVAAIRALRSRDNLALVARLTA